MKVQDWSALVSFDAKVLKPKRLAELKKGLIDLSKDGTRPRSIRLVGGLHSCAKIFESDVVIDMGDMPKEIEYNNDHTRASLSTNWRLGDLLLELSKYEKSLNATGGEDSQTLAGLISTNTAPATPLYGIYENVEWVEYVTFSKDKKSVVEKHLSKNDFEFQAVICSLGAVGILTKVQFKLIEAPYFETVQKIIPINDVLENISNTSNRYDFWRINWLQNTDQGLFWGATEIPREKADRHGDYKPDLAENILKRMFKTLAKLGEGGPLLDSIWEKAIMGLVRIGYTETKASGPLRNMLPVDRHTNLRVAMAEWFFNPDDMHNVMECCRLYFKKNYWPNLPIEIELGKTDNYFMSQLNFKGLDFIVKFNFQYLTDSCNEDEKQEIYVHLEGLWDDLVKARIHFKAHWGKINFMDYNYVRTHYQLDEFKGFICKEFINSYLAERLNPPPR